MSGPCINAAFYAAPVREFLATSDEEAYAPLAVPKGYTLASEQLSAAPSVYARHPVHKIARSDPGVVNLSATSGCIERILAAANAGRLRAIVLVTGVLEAGKTLVGLNVAMPPGERCDSALPAFLTGSGLLMAVLGQPLARDDLDRIRRTAPKHASAPLATSSGSLFTMSITTARTHSATTFRPKIMS